MRHRGRSRSRIIHYYNRVFNNQPEFLNLDISGKFALLLSFAPLLLAPCLASTTSLLLLGRAAGRCGCCWAVPAAPPGASLRLLPAAGACWLAAAVLVFLVVLLYSA